MSDNPLQNIFLPIQQDLELVNLKISKECQNVHSHLLEELLAHTFSVRGKLLRPAITICAAALSGGTRDERAILIASGLEILHTASLVHDDIIDGGTIRRGKPTINHAWGLGEATLLGDWLLAKAFDLMVQTSVMEIIHGMTLLTEELTEGQFLEMEISRREGSEPEYFKMIDLKTSSIFRSACTFGGLLASKDKTSLKKLADFGTFFGLYFQIVDDLLDVLKEPEETLKTSGVDLGNGLKTLPILRGLHLESLVGNEHLKRLLHSANESDHRFDLGDYLMRVGAIKSCLETAKHYREKCDQILISFPDSAHKTLLQSLLQLIENQVISEPERSHSSCSS